MLLGQKEQLTKSIVERTSILTHKQLNVSFAEQKKNIEALYSIRSKYVHEGKSINKTSVEDISRTTTLILKILLIAKNI